MQVDIVPGHVSMPTLLGIFLSYDRSVGHLPKYAPHSYRTYIAKEV